MKTITATMALALLPAAASAQAEAAFPAWLAGAWSLADGEGGWTEEFWTPPRGGLMIGASREGKGDALRSWETIRIQRKADGSIVFIAQPGGAPPVEFQMVKQDAGSIEFANPAHDYPQRIRYWREDNRLSAEISLLDGSSAVSWTYRPMGD